MKPEDFASTAYSLESKLTTVFMMNDEKGLNGSFSTQLGNQESQTIRKKLSATDILFKL